MWELSHGLEWVAATGLVATLVAPHIDASGGSPRCIFVALSFAVVLLLSALAAATARLAIDTSGALLLAMHAHLRGSGHLVRALHEVQVMNILTMLWKNLRRGYRTLLFPARPKVTPRLPRPGASSIPRSAPAAPSADSAAPRAPSSSKPARANSPGATTPASAPSAAAALKAARTRAQGRPTEDACQQDTPPIYLTIGELEEVLHRCPQATRSQARRRACRPVSRPAACRRPAPPLEVAQ